MPNSDELYAAGTKGCQDFSLSLLVVCDLINWRCRMWSDPQNFDKARRVSLLGGEVQLAGCLRELEGCPLEWNISTQWQCVIKNTANEASMRAATPNWCAVLSS